MAVPLCSHEEEDASPGVLPVPRGPFQQRPRGRRCTYQNLWINRLLRTGDVNAKIHNPAVTPSNDREDDYDANPRLVTRCIGSINAFFHSGTEYRRVIKASSTCTSTQCWTILRRWADTNFVVSRDFPTLETKATLLRFVVAATGLTLVSEFKLTVPGTPLKIRHC